jgi:hypothetical protein
MHILNFYGEIDILWACSPTLSTTAPIAGTKF